MKLTARHLACLGLSLSMLLALPARALAWGGQGHRIVAQLAMLQLWREGATDMDARRARRMVYRMLQDGNTTLEAASVWPDTVRRSAAYGYADNWHFVSIPRGETSYEASEQCRVKPTAPEGDCAIGGLTHFRKVMLDGQAARDDRLDALRFIIHIVGDIHQPLHTSEDRAFIHNGEPGDRGGNFRRVCFLRVSQSACTEVFDGERKPRNLHSTWDKYMIIQTGVAEEDYVARLDARVAGLPAATLAAHASGAPARWVEEAHAVAGVAAYTPSLVRDLSFPHNQTYDDYFFVSQSYQADNIERVDEQLMKAGIRLAAYLKQLYRDMQ